MTVDWTNPTVQGALVAAAISLVGVAIAGAAGVIGAIAGARISAAEMTREGERQRRDAATTRVREWNVRRIEDTRTQLIAVTDGFLALMEKDVPSAQQHFRQMNQQLLANARLVGDLESLAATARAVVSTTSVLKGNRLLIAVRLATTNPFRDEDREAMRNARAGILNALERQQERALRDEALVELTADQVASIPEFNAAADALEDVRQDTPE